MKVTDTQIKKWKSQFGEVHLVEVVVRTEDGTEDTASAYFRKPDLEIISAIQAFDGDDIKQAIIVFENCWLGGDERIRKSDECKLAAANLVAPLFKLPAATIKKL